MKKSPAFTLIELLIVVAIIAILAAIAVPNFLEAQTRSKVSRVQADMRSMATAIESYHVDHGHYPIPACVMTGTLAIVYPMPSAMHSMYDHNFLPAALTTPVAYLTTIPLDVFGDLAMEPSPEQATIYYQSWEHTRYLAAVAATPFNPAQAARERAFGPWVMFGCGPDRDRKDLAPDRVGPTGLVNGVYDPTNGTVSNGDVIRSQRATASFAL